MTDVMDDATEAMEDQQEVQEAIATGFGNPFGIDEDDLLGELAALEEEELDNQLIGLAGAPANINSGMAISTPQPQTDPEEQELERQMAAMMAA